MADYPPVGQVLSTLGIEVKRVDDDTLSGRALVDPTLLGRGSGPPGMGALSPIVDLTAGSLAAATADGDWLATSDMWLYERAPITVGAILLETRLLRVGKRSMVLAVEVSDDGGPTGSATVEFSRIRREASPHQTRVADQDSDWIRIGSGPLLDRPLFDACGFVVTDPGRGEVEIHRSDFVANSIGTLQGGVMMMLAEVSATAPFGEEGRLVDMQFRFLDQTAEGPAVAAAEVVRREETAVVVMVRIADRGNGRLVGHAICRVAIT